MDRLVCYNCGEWMEVEKNGVTVRMKDYVGIFHADLWVCPACGNRVLVGFKQERMSDEDAEIDYNLFDYLLLER